MAQRDTKWITLSLALSTASTGPQLVALSLLMPEISTALNTPITQLGQLNTAFSIIATIGSLIMGIITVRYPPKRLLQTGIIILLLGIILAAYSTSYPIMLVSFILYGIGNSLVLPIATLLLILYPLETRTNALGKIYSGRSLTSIIATPIIGTITAAYGWRAGYIGFGAPLIILAIILITIKIPEQPPSTEKPDLTAGFREISRHTSAKACLIGAALSLAFFNGLMVFNGAYTRNQLNLNINTASIALSATFIAIALGQFLSGTIASKIGVKTTTWLSTAIGAISLLTYFTIQLPIPLAILTSAIGTAMAGITMTTMATLALEQLPNSRGTMMSLNSAAMSLSAMLSTTIGGIAIDTLGFPGFGISMFILAAIAAIIFRQWTREATPNR